MRGFKTASAAIIAIGLCLPLAACGSSGSGGGSLGGGASGGGTSFVPTVAKNPQFAAGTEMAKLAKQGSITIGTKFDQPLFGLQELGGKLTGFDVQIATIIAGDLGIPANKIHWVQTPSKVRESYIEQGRVNMVVATYAITPERRNLVTFGGPYYVAGSEIMVKAGNKQITGPESFKHDSGLKVCAGIGSIDALGIKKYLASSNQLVQFDDLSKCASALKQGQVDAVAVDSATMLGLIYKNPGAFKEVGKPFVNQPFGIGITKGDTAFCKFINTSLQKAVADGSYAKAWKATAGKADPKVPALPKLGPCS